MNNTLSTQQSFSKPLLLVFLKITPLTFFSVYDILRFLCIFEEIFLLVDEIVFLLGE